MAKQAGRQERKQGRKTKKGGKEKEEKLYDLSTLACVYVAGK
jgi:hypothetical protein